MNRLGSERSPYLLQHAHNPVDWYPWGDDAFALARSLDRPVFLSVGYSACHWCHVMERESFEDPATAEFLNAHFVSVKVDREERPDVDQAYQLAHQALARRAGGWPLSMFLAPDRRPFVGGTYFPNARRYGMPSFLEVLRSVKTAWDTQRDEVSAQAEALTEVVRRATEAPQARTTADRSLLPSAVREALRRADGRHGGFGTQPKFPNTMALELLVVAAVEDPEGLGASALEALGRALDGMARGGLRDHLGGGFARYSTDAQWKVPHFEKMLYDNALLARLYLRGTRLFARDPARAPLYREATRGILRWCQREMVSPSGVFYASQDADSEGEEGRYFVWTREELTEVLGASDGEALAAWFDVTPAGNFEHGRSVLWTPGTAQAVAATLGWAPERLVDAVVRATPRLLEARARRPRPATDDKCLAAWNGLMISAFADAGAALEDPELVAVGQRALGRWRTLAWDGATLRHAIKGDEAYGTGFLDDHGALACAALEVFEAASDGEALAFARALGDAILARFSDDQGVLCATPSDAEVVLSRPRDPHDHAMPGGLGLASSALLRLHALTGEARYHEGAERALGPFLEAARGSPLGLASVVLAGDRLARPPFVAMVLGPRGDPRSSALTTVLREFVLPHCEVLQVASEAEGLALGLDPSLVGAKGAGPEGAPRVYLCHGARCEAPVGEPEALREVLATLLAET
ncbi:MAG: thioredoxin domain-containing protein [Deltaproteobacteria bacterium]|nr:thioredoxin domain-containing protein [Deltaproteobacteria bacterium]